MKKRKKIRDLVTSSSSGFINHHINNIIFVNTLHLLFSDISNELDFIIKWVFITYLL